jgi:hypothetical protein
MVSLASPPPVRHGISRLTLQIGGIDYRLRRPPDQPKGFRIWTLRKLDPDGPPACYAVAKHGCEIRCTCPDHTNRGAYCKHIMALLANGLISGRIPADPKPASTARIRKAHAKNARAAIAEANGLDPAARRHLAEITGPPAEPPSPIKGTARRAAIAGLPCAEEMDIRLEIGAFPAAPARPFADGFRQAVQAHLRKMRGETEAEPEDESGPVPTCIVCGLPFDPEISRDPYACADCVEGGRS